MRLTGVELVLGGSFVSITMRPSSRRCFMTAAAAAFLLAGGVTGCWVEKSPAPPYPAVEWQDGVPVSPLEENPWIQAARQSLEAQAVAQNTLDFRLPELEQTTGVHLRSRLASHTTRDMQQNRQSMILPGPVPFAPLTVTRDDQNGENRMVVHGCEALEWSSEEGAVPTDPKATRADLFMEQLDSGQMRITARTSRPVDPGCENITLPIALFKPAPTPSNTSGKFSIVQPGPSDFDPK